MSKRAIDLRDAKFGRLTVLERTGQTSSGNVLWRCKCECGNEKDIPAYRLKAGRTNSCGCLAKEEVSRRMMAHGMSRTQTWNSWNCMVRRCTEKGFAPYVNYGGRGVKVCERWLKSFENFLDDMGERPKGMTLDRIDNNGDYTPDNCRWATAEQQSNNRGKFNVKVRHGGRLITMKEFAAIRGVALVTAYKIAEREGLKV